VNVGKHKQTVNRWSSDCKQG